jgi:hypothetical protein
MTGGVSHLESFDPKPRLAADAGKKHNGRTLLGPQFKFARAGKSGTDVSELFPNVATCVDDLCVIKSLTGSHFEHFQATLGVHTGSLTVKRPSIGSWVSYGLGTENKNLPSFVVLAPFLPYAGTQVWSSDFLPVSHQGTRVLPGRSRCRTSAGGRPARPCRRWSWTCSAGSTAGTSRTARATRCWPGGSSRSRPRSACRARCPTCST